MKTLHALSLAALLAGCAPKRLPDAEDRTGPRFTAQVPMRDGVELHTRVLLPKGDGPFPTVFVRVPYPIGKVLNARCARLNRHGYACAWQTVRGRGRSGGDWLPFEHEIDDGLDALTWLVAQPWVDGNVALMGESYLGAVQWAVADALPPEVKTMVPSVIGTDLYMAAYEGGLFRHEIGTAWMALMPDRDFYVLSGSRRYRRALDHRPRQEADEAAVGRALPWYRAWTAAERPDAPFWQRDIAQRALRAPEHTDVPVLMIAGWSDAFLGPQLATWDRLASQPRSTLVVGPWEHLGRVAADVRQAPVDDEIGLNASYSQWARVIDWFDHHLKGKPAAWPVGKVLTFPINGDGWVVRDTWPPPTTPRAWSLQPGDRPGVCTGGLAEAEPPPVERARHEPHGLEPAAAADEVAVAWTYDPADPTPALGGAGLLAGALPAWRGVAPGFVDQKRLCDERDDLIGFRSEPLAAPLHVAGGLKATLRFASDAPDTAVGVRFLEERADGRRIHVRESITSLSLRDGVDTEAYTPGEIVTVSLETWPVEYVFEAGSRLLVQVASASFPKYEAHSNVVGPQAAVTATAVARQRLVLDGSLVVLPELAP